MFTQPSRPHSHHRGSEQLFLGLPTVLLLLLPAQGRADQPSGRATKEPYDLNLVTHVIPVLPFDVPFELRVTTHVETIQLQLQYAAKGKAITCNAQQLPASIDSKVPPFDSKVVTTDQQATTSQVTIGMPILPPNVELCAHIRLIDRLNAQQLTPIRASIRDALDHRLRTFSDASLFGPASEKLRQALWATIVAAAPPGSTPQPAPNSIFGKAPDQAAARERLDRYDQIMLDVISGQTNRQVFVIPKTCQLAVDTQGTIPPLLGLAQHLDAQHRAAIQPSIDALRGARVLPDCQRQLDEVWHREELHSLATEVAALTGNVAAVTTALANADPIATNALAKAQALATELDVLASRLAERDKGLDGLMLEVSDLLERDVTLELSPISEDLATRATWYLSVDVGLGQAWDLSKTFTYAGLNLYFRPINKQAPLRRGEPDLFTKRFSVMLGFTITDIKDSSARPQFQGVLGARTVLTALGWRVLDSVRVSIGGVWLREADRNPLVSHDRTRLSPFAAISLDWDAKSTLTKLGDALGVKGGT